MLGLQQATLGFSALYFQLWIKIVSNKIFTKARPVNQDYYQKSLKNMVARTVESYLGLQRTRQLHQILLLSQTVIPDHRGSIGICLTLNKNCHIGKELWTCTLTGTLFLHSWAGQVTFNTISEVLRVIWGLLIILLICDEPVIFY